MGRFKDMTGKKIGRWEVLRRVENKIVSSTNQYAMFLCRCECGTEKKLTGKVLRRGVVKSCGCLKAELVGDINKTHGLSNHRLYGLWCGIRTRCNNENATGYKNYGGRGIKMCSEWDDFETFLKDMEPTYVEGLTIDRIDVNKGYYKENCRWVTPAVQSMNKRDNVKVNYRGQKIRLLKLAQSSNVFYKVIYQRVVNYGWDIDDALKTPVVSGNRNPKSKQA